jgi:TolA-binding protein
MVRKKIELLATILVFIIFGICVNVYALDEVILKNGSKLKGEIIGADNVHIMLEDIDKKAIYTIEYSDILRVDVPKPQVMILADNHFFFEDYETAYKEYLEVMARFGPVSWGAKANLRAAECLMKMNQKDRALKMYEDFIDKYPAAANIDYFKKELGDIFFKDGNWADAARLYKEVAFSKVSSELKGEAFYKLADAYFNEGNYEKALVNYLQVVVLYFKEESAVQAKYKSALCYEKLNDAKRALRTYKEFIEQYPQNANVSKAENRIRILSKKENTS